MVTTADKIAAMLRPIAPERKFTQAEVEQINQIATSWDKRTRIVAPNPSPLREPLHVAVLRAKLGEAEIVGPKHNRWIADGWAKLKAGWFNDDETPWCGFAIAWALNEAGLPYPKNFPSAASFATYGTACTPRLGAIGVKARTGGNHVFEIVGQTPDALYFKALGGNQGNRVSIMDIPKASVNHIRWPAGLPLVDTGLPVLPKGTISRNEA